MPPLIKDFATTKETNWNGGHSVRHRNRKDALIRDEGADRLIAYRKSYDLQQERELPEAYNQTIQRAELVAV